MKLVSSSAALLQPRPTVAENAGALPKAVATNKRATAGIAIAAVTVGLVAALLVAAESGVHANTGEPQDHAVPSKLFLRLDTDHDGFVSRAEAYRQKDFTEAFDAADKNRAGRLNPAEFAVAEAIYQRMMAAMLVDDSIITAKIKAQLLRDPEVSALEVGVETYKGRVLLSGFVDSSRQIRKAIRIASSVRGVHEVQDSLLIK